MSATILNIKLQDLTATERLGHLLGEIAEPGDVIIHYQNGQIYALGQAKKAGYSGQKPKELQAHDWNRDGWRADIQYYRLNSNIKLHQLDVDLRSNPKNGVFDRYKVRFLPL